MRMCFPDSSESRLQPRPDTKIACRLTAAGFFVALSHSELEERFSVTRKFIGVHGRIPSGPGCGQGHACPGTRMRGAGLRHREKVRALGHRLPVLGIGALTARHRAAGVVLRRPHGFLRYGQVTRLRVAFAGHPDQNSPHDDAIAKPPVPIRESAGKPACEPARPPP